MTNLEVFTGDVKVYDFAGKKSFDRIMSIEMFEHMKNYEALLAKISTWLKPNAEAKTGEALLFVHIFAHKTTPYHFEEEADGSMSWMTKHFFSGGTMPSFDLFTHFQKNLTLEKSWWVNGKHYGRTSEDWLKRQDSGTKTWIGTDREAELVTGEGTLEERRAEGRKSFYRSVDPPSLAVADVDAQMEDVLPHRRCFLCDARWRSVGSWTLFVQEARLDTARGDGATDSTGIAQLMREPRVASMTVANDLGLARSMRSDLSNDGAGDVPEIRPVAVAPCEDSMDR